MLLFELKSMREGEGRANWSARRWDFLTCFRRRKFAHHLHITARVVKETRDYRLELYACSSFPSFLSFFFFHKPLDKAL